MQLLLVHGVGLGSESFAELAALARSRDIPVTVVDRRGYDGRSATADLRRHVADLAACVDEQAESQGPVVAAGVSGGATLTLALAAAGHPGLHAAVVHEPLIGPAASEQHAVIGDSIRRLATDDSPDAFAHFMKRLLTPSTWEAITAADRTAIRVNEPAARVESEGFARFSLRDDQLTVAGKMTTWTVGARSPKWRRDAASVAEALGVTVRTVDAAHTPQLESPDEWLDVVVAAGTSR